MKIYEVFNSDITANFGFFCGDYNHVDTCNRILPHLRLKLTHGCGCGFAVYQEVVRTTDENHVLYVFVRVPCVHMDMVVVLVILVQLISFSDYS